MTVNTKRRVVVLMAGMAVSFANAQSTARTYFKFKLCSSDKYAKESGVSIDQNFYKKFVNAGPMPVLTSGKVPGMQEMRFESESL